MSGGIYVHGYGAVSPAGWGLGAFRDLLAGGQMPQPQSVARPDGASRRVLRVPPATVRPAWGMHPRLRRASPISHFTTAAALEALGQGDRPGNRPGLGIVSCVMGGSVQYSRRFFGEVLAEPSTASPLLFPETVFNAPASHLGALLGTGARNDTCVADETGFLAGLAHAAEWIACGEVESCLVVAAEEADWSTSEALRVFRRGAVGSEGAAAVLLSANPGGALAELAVVSSPVPYRAGRSRSEVSVAVESQLGLAAGQRRHVHGTWPSSGPDAVAIDRVLGNGLAAAGGWSCVAAVDAVAVGGMETASAWVAGSNLQAMAAAFRRVKETIE